MHNHWFSQPKDFTPIVMVNVTTLLVLTTLFISVSDSLPRTSYVKLIDVWLIVSLMVPFANIIVQTVINILQEDNLDEDDDDGRMFERRSNIKPSKGRNRNGRRQSISPRKMMLFTSRVVLPGFYIVVCVIFFLIAANASEL